MRDTRAELLMLAETLVRATGYAGFSYADLAAAVGIRKASIHHHFPTKTDLAVALVAAYAERYAAALAAIELAHAEAPARVAAYGRLYLGGVEQGLGCLCAVLAVEGDALPERLRADISRFFEDHIAWLDRVLRDGLAGGTVRPDLDPAAQARLVIATLEGALLLERLLGGSAAFAGTLDALVAGLRPDQTSAAAKRA
jgi:TetR/AcrR family transcriptional regulator, transcriptional repressor for nem operon